MKPFLQKIFHAGGRIATALARLRARTGLIFLSKRQNARLAAARSETLKQEEMEAERLDRLRNPSNYQGR